MEHKSSAFRHFSCLSTSVLLHSLIVIGLGFASANMFLKKGEGDGEGKAIEVAVVGTEAPAPVSVVETPAQVVTPTPVVTPEPVKPVEVKKTVAKKVKSEPKIKQTVQPQPAVEVTESTVEEAPVVVAEEVKQEEEVVQPQQTQEEQPLPEKVEVVEEKAAPTEQAVEQAQAQSAVAVPVAEAAPDVGSGAAGGQQGTAEQAAPIATAEAPQNFLSLRQAAGNKPPNYTRDMRLNKLEGRGQLQYYVTKAGTVSDIKVTQSTGRPDLDRAAVDAFSKYKFIPGQEGYTVHHFEFTLKGPAEADSGRLRTTYK